MSRLTLFLLAVLLTPQVWALDSCSNGASPKTFHISADPLASHLPAIPGLGATGGPGFLVGLIAQQASDDGYREISINGPNQTIRGIEAEFVDRDIADGTVIFEACTDQGFLLIGIYINEAGGFAGFPSDVLGAQHAINYANINRQSNQRIGVGFNAQGAAGALNIIRKGLESQSEVDVPRAIAEQVLTQNVASVVDFSESQAPVFNLSSNDCVVKDQFIYLRSISTSCSASLNSAVTAIERFGEDQWNPDTLSGFKVEPFELYKAIIGEGDGAREVFFLAVVSRDQVAPKTFSSDPEQPTQLTLVDGVTYIEGQVDAPRNTRDIFSFNIPEGKTLSGVYLMEWDSQGIDLGFAHLDAGTSTVIPTQDTQLDFLGGLHINSELYDQSDNLLVGFSLALQGGTGFDLPLGSGDYSLLIQQTGDVPSRYVLKFVVANSL